MNSLDPELRGQAASIGIVNGKKFAPAERMKKILTDAVAIWNATARAIAFRTRDSRAPIYEKINWQAFFFVGDYRWLNDGGLGGRKLDARPRFFYIATVNTPAMAAKIPGKGSQYAGAFMDTDGNNLDGAKKYRLHVPANVAAKGFGSVVAYDLQTRSELQTSRQIVAQITSEGSKIRTTMTKKYQIEL